MQELYSSNRYYGAGDILRDYCGFTSKLPLPVSLQHGWTVAPTEHDAKSNAAENWYWAEEMELKYKEKFNKLCTRSVGAPFLYLLQNINYKPLPWLERSGSIIFPCHSAKYIHNYCDYPAYAEMLDRLPDEYKPITVSVYFLDDRKEITGPFIEKGFSVVTNGTDLYDKKFLCNFIENCRSKKYAFSNERSSALLYTVAMGLKAYYYGPETKTDIKPDATSVDRETVEDQWVLPDTWKEKFIFPDCNTADQELYCRDILGIRHMLEKKEMSILLNKLLLNSRYLNTYLRKIFGSNKLLVKIYRKANNLFSVGDD